MPIIVLSFNIVLKVNTRFKAVYQNFTNKYYLDVCIEYAIISIRSLQLVKTLFDGVSCGNLIASNTTLKNLFVSDMFEYCNDNMEVHNMTAATDGENELFCDFTGNMTTVETTIQGNTTSRSTTSSETITNDFTNMHQTTNSVFVKQTTSDISEWKTSIYILVPAAGVFLVLGIVTLVVRRRKRTQAQQREKSYETIIIGGQTQYSNMTDFSHNYDVIGYRNGTKEERGS